MTGVPHPPDQIPITRAERQKREARRRRSLKKSRGPVLGDILLIMVLACVAVMLYALIQSKSSGKAPELAGRQFYIVQSDTMKPVFGPGSLLAVRPVEPAGLKKGDIIAFIDPDNPSGIVNHRITAVNADAGLTFTTRGDANPKDDPTAVPAENIIGKGAFFIPYAGYLLGFIQTTVGLISVVLAPALLIVILELRKLLRHAAVHKKEREGSSGLL